jgi:hypothetical protein
VKHKNFYENAKEANLRLRNTVVWYDGPGEQGPYFVMVITDHDGADFKIYMKRIGQKYYSVSGVMPPNEVYPAETTGFGKLMDKFMKDYPKFGIIRKDLSSPHFRAFRPFPLGMMNLVRTDKNGKAVDCETLYLERQPNRATQQGLTRTMIYISPVNAAMARDPVPMHHSFDLWSEDFYDCVMGKYPSIDTCLSKLRDPTIANEAAAFHRYFALVKGPIGMVFLSYKGDIVGVLDNKNLSSLTVDRDFNYTREAISDLHVFNSING